MRFANAVRDQANMNTPISAKRSNVPATIIQ